MLYMYDNAIAEDLRKSFDPSSSVNDIVKVISPDNITDLLAQIQEDRVKFPIVALARDEDTPIDTSRTNFTMMHRGVRSVYDSPSNTVYLEKVLPIQLNYTLTLLTTNVADMDELLRELLFKYINTYFITIDELPYEDSRPIRFGIRIDPDSIKRASSTFEYLTEGALNQTQIRLMCEGAVLLTYTPKHVERFAYTDVVLKPTSEP